MSLIPRATYRLQLHKEFGFGDVAAIAPYLGRLGISHVYVSSWLKARPGSTHGYDVVDHTALNPELGSEQDFTAMIAALRGQQLGIILDFVPNHMGVGGAENAAWLDVLEWGPSSRHAGYFDIDWDPDRRYLRDKLLVPFLGSQYGEALRKGDVALKVDAEHGDFAVWAYDAHKLPVCPLHYDEVLRGTQLELARLGDAFSDLAYWQPQMAERADELKAELAAALRDPTTRATLDATIAAINADPARLDALIERQYWRLAFFGVASDDINYRRFFNINDLAGLRMELPSVFRDAHRRIRRWLDDGTLDGIRLDHIDGLLDPKTYLVRLRELSERPFYLVVEKILSAHESLRPDWPVEGTTGYDFTNQILGALIDPAAEPTLDAFYRDFTGIDTPFESIVHECKLRIMDVEMASELNVLGRDAGRIARQNPLTADFTRHILQRALRQIVACFPVYRTYIDGEGTPTEADRRDLDWAISQARRREPVLDPSVFDFLAALLSGELASAPDSGFSRTRALRLAMKAQQYSGPVMAKGLEDTAFYRYNRFVALNEVGGEPDRFGLSANAFHRANAQRAKHWPSAMLGTSTHDTKRGEDTRARLAVLADLPEEWTRQVQGWSRLLRARRGDVEGNAPPDRNDEYLLYQLLIGSWPVEMLDEVDAKGLETYGERIAGALEKSMREAKLHSSWAMPDEAYETAMQTFARDALDPERAAFFNSFLPFARRIAEAGVRNSLAQTVAKLTLPGMPDTYQGCEMWDLSLVDPDNRRPVDYAAREAALARLAAVADTDRAAHLRELLREWRSGAIKLAVTHALLELRSELPELFAHGSYEPLTITPAQAAEGELPVLGWRRVQGEVELVAVITRFPGRDTSVSGLAAIPSGVWDDVLSQRSVTISDDAIALDTLLDGLPVAVLVRR